MHWQNPALVRPLEKVSRAAATAAAALGLLLLLLRVLVHFPFYDEAMHAHQLWLLSSGLSPSVDFFCSHPALSYLLLLPFFRLFPETAFVLLALRLVSVMLWALVGALLAKHGRLAGGDRATALLPFVLLAASTTVGPFLSEFSIDPFAALAAVAALALFFRPPRFWTVAGAAALSLLSVATTPKYALPLFFGLLGLAAGLWQTTRSPGRTFLALALGGLTTTLAAWAVYGLGGVSVAANLQTSLVVNSKLALGRGDTPLALPVLEFLCSHPVYAAAVATGLWGWARRARRTVDAVTLAGAGVLLGLGLFCARMKFPLEQYQTPVYVSLALFAPFASFEAGVRRPWVRFGLSVAALVTVAFQFPAVAREFGSTSMNLRDAASTRAAKGPPGVAALGDTGVLLRLIPPNESVVALWPHHPLFRRDVTGMAGDDRPSLADFLEPGDPLMRFFDPAVFREALERHPPALLDLGRLGINYPPGWDQVAGEFLAAHQELYVPLPSPYYPNYDIFLRRDLTSRARRR